MHSQWSVVRPSPGFFSSVAGHTCYVHTYVGLLALGLRTRTWYMYTVFRVSTCKHVSTSEVRDVPYTARNPKSKISKCQKQDLIPSLCDLKISFYLHADSSLLRSLLAPTKRSLARDHYLLFFACQAFHSSSHLLSTLIVVSQTSWCPLRCVIVLHRGVSCTHVHSYRIMMDHGQNSLLERQEDAFGVESGANGRIWWHKTCMKHLVLMLKLATQSTPWRWAKAAHPSPTFPE